MPDWIDALADRLAGADFTIRHRHGRPLVVRGRVPRARLDALRAFFEHDLPGAAGAVRVRGRTATGGRLDLDIAGSLDPAARQRLRNFLLATLG